MLVVEDIQLQDSGAFPNSAFPALAYRAALAPSGDRSTASAFESLFSRHGWLSAWRDTIYAGHHFHSTAHECLGIASGSVRVQLGGPQGQTLELDAGDVLVIPAGVAHCRLAATADLLVVGAYPPGQSPDLLHGQAEERPHADVRIALLVIPATDPVEGAGGTLPRRWQATFNKAPPC